MQHVAHRVEIAISWLVPLYSRVGNPTTYKRRVYIYIHIVDHARPSRPVVSAIISGPPVYTPTTVDSFDRVSVDWKFVTACRAFAAALIALLHLVQRVRSFVPLVAKRTRRIRLIWHDKLFLSLNRAREFSIRNNNLIYPEQRSACWITGVK